MEDYGVQQMIDFINICGTQLKEVGIKQTLENESDTWRERAIELLGSYARIKHEPFSMDEFRQGWKDLGYAEPHHPNCWGAVTNVAAKRHLIKRTGQWIKSTHPAAHNRYTQLWVAA